MCTVSFTARRRGYALAMNRDEQRARIAGLPPELFRVNGRVALHPAEPGGGTWISLNDAGVTFALINWYSIRRRVESHPLSRGEVVLRARAAESVADARAALGELSLPRVNPFRLIGVFPRERAVREWRWDLATLREVAHRWVNGIWISSGFDEPGAQRTRGKTFNQALQQSSVGRSDWLRRLHRSHSPMRGAYSTCMHRADAATVSYTEITVTHRTGTLRYAPGAPCCTTFLPAKQFSLCRVL
jgi:Transport and Golgi organisation 2